MAIWTCCLSILSVHLWAASSLRDQAAHIQVWALLPIPHPHAQMCSCSCQFPSHSRDKLLIRHHQLSPLWFAGAAAASHYGFTLGLISNEWGPQRHSPSCSPWPRSRRQELQQSRAPALLGHWPRAAHGAWQDSPGWLAEGVLRARTKPRALTI